MSSSPWGSNNWGEQAWGDNGIDVTFGNTWGEQAWGEFAWGSGNLTDALSTGIGSVSISIGVNQNITGQELQSLIGEETVTADANLDITGIQLTTSIEGVITTAEASVTLTGLQLTGTVVTPDIAAGGNITVNASEDQLDALVGEVTEVIEVGPVTVGIEATLSINGVTAQADADVEVTNSAPLFQFTTEGNAQLSTAQAKFGTASLELDGTDDYIETTTNLDLSSTDFTIDLWIRPDNVTGYKGIWQSGTSTTMQSYLLGNAVYWSVNPSTIITTAVTVNANEWTMLSYERQGNTHRIYKNGTLADTVSTGNKQDNGPFSIGKNGFGDFNGYIDEVRVSDIARYTGSSFTEPTSEFEFDSNTNVLIHLDGANGSTDIKSADDTAFPGIISEGQVTPIPGIFVDVTGIAMTIALGEETAFTDVEISVTGQSMTMAIGEVDAVSIAEVTGQELNSNIGSVTITAAADVDLTGISMTASIGAVKVTAWQKVDPGVNNTWTEVDTEASNSWSEVDLAA